MNRFGDMLEDEQAAAAGSFVEAPGVRHKLVGSPVLLSAVDATPLAGPARHGEHTERVLGELLGCSAEELAGLREEGLVGF